MNAAAEWPQGRRRRAGRRSHNRCLIHQRNRARHHSKLRHRRRSQIPGSDCRRRKSRRFDSISSSLMRRIAARPARRPAVKAACCSIPGACNCCQDISIRLCKPLDGGWSKYVSMFVAHEFLGLRHSAARPGNPSCNANTIRPSWQCTTGG
jgi:hypothetical protein